MTGQRSDDRSPPRLPDLGSTCGPLVGCLVTAWKRHELRVAKALGGTRTGPQGKHGSDVAGTPFAVECKRTTRYSLRGAWIEQARRQSRQEGKPWILVVSEHGDRSPIVVMEFSALLELLNVSEEEAA